MCALALLLACPVGQAQEQAAQIKHVPPSAEELEKTVPSKPLKFSISMARTRSIDMRIQMVASIDGNMVTSPLANPTYNDKDELVFFAEVPAPLERMTYQFFAYNGSEVEASRRFILERKCVPSIADSRDAQSAATLPDKQSGMAPLIEKADSLERENDLLNASLSTLTEMKPLLVKEKQQ